MGLAGHRHPRLGRSLPAYESGLLPCLARLPLPHGTVLLTGLPRHHPGLLPRHHPGLLPRHHPRLLPRHQTGMSHMLAWERLTLSRTLPRTLSAAAKAHLRRRLAHLRRPPHAAHVLLLGVLGVLHRCRVRLHTRVTVHPKRWLLLLDLRRPARPARPACAHADRARRVSSVRARGRPRGGGTLHVLWHVLLLLL